MRKFNSPLSSFNHWTPSSKDAIHTKTEISLQRHFYFGSSKSLNTPHPNEGFSAERHGFASMPSAVHQDMIKDDNSENWKMNFGSTKTAAILCYNSNREGRAAWMLCKGKRGKFVHRDVSPEQLLITRQIEFTAVVLVVFQNGWSSANKQAASFFLIEGEGWYWQFLLKAESINKKVEHTSILKQTWFML